MKRPRIVLTDAAVTDILEQADRCEQHADQKLAKRWGNAATATLLRIVEKTTSFGKQSKTVAQLHLRGAAIRGGSVCNCNGGKIRPLLELRAD